MGLSFVVLFGVFTILGDGVVARADGAVKAVPTFAKDIAPILYENCTSCHRPGDIAPMSLITYRDTRPWARAIKDTVLAGEMPP
ncbi:MAG: thiol-disulfide isomerase, partial [Acidobacteria bacterium]|nr:thiol-disulfide isomerase [Acidobacteriota bacterium]